MAIRDNRSAHYHSVYLSKKNLKLKERLSVVADLIESNVSWLLAKMLKPLVLICEKINDVDGYVTDYEWHVLIRHKKTKKWMCSKDTILVKDQLDDLEQ